jgi:hypothetical protein
MNKYYPPLEIEKHYHIYNNGIGELDIFKSEDNYNFFLKKIIFQIADTSAYCLLPNHFHFVLKIKSEEGIMKIFTHLSESFKLLIAYIHTNPIKYGFLMKMIFLRCIIMELIIILF